MQRNDTNGTFQSDARPAESPAPDFPFEIPPGTDLNQPAEHQRQKTMSDEVFDNLPDFLREACLLLDETEREVFLVAALGVLSGCLPKVRGHYDGKFVSPHLYVYLLGGYGTGKGAAELARALGAEIDRAKKEETKAADIAYKAAFADWKEAAHPKPEMPVKPPHKMLFIPVDNRRGGLVQLLAENDGEGVLFETEADTLTDSMSTDQGAFSDILRKAFHHEPITLFRKTADEFRDIPEPRTAVVLTSTPDQMRRLIPSAENGLFSRFAYFELTPDLDFRDVFDTARRERPEYFKKAGEAVLMAYNALQNAGGIEFELRPDQKARFQNLFSQWKTEFGEYIDLSMIGTANRLGLICFRVAMVLTAVRAIWQGDVSPKMLCEDRDFENALRLMEVFKINARRIYRTFPDRPAAPAEKPFEKGIEDKVNKLAAVKRLAAEGLNPMAISQKLGIPKSTVYRWVEG